MSIFVGYFMCMTKAIDQYRQYICSYAWRGSTARLQELASALNRCRLCNASSSEAVLHVHHRTYERFGAEWATDLTTLCEECHDVVTNMLRGRRYVRREPKFCDFVRPLPKPSALFDPTRGD